MSTALELNRWVLHIDMDAFFASCEQLTRPTLRGRPVLVGGRSGRGVVAGASYEARAFGARSAMPINHAARLIGYSATIITPRFAIYKALSRVVFRRLGEHGDLIEQLSIDEGFLEPAQLRGATTAQAIAYAEELRTLIREQVGLPASVGLGHGKAFAKIASDLAKPDGVYAFDFARGLADFHSREVGRISGVGPVAQTKLARLEITTIGQLHAASPGDLRTAVGTASASYLQQIAAGYDPRPVAPRARVKSIGRENTFATDLLLPTEVQASLSASLADCHRRLLRDGRAATTVTVKTKLTDFSVTTRSVTLPFATRDRDTFATAVTQLAPDPTTTLPIRLLGVSLSGLVDTYQEHLFPELDIDAVAAPRTARVLGSDDWAEAGMVPNPAADIHTHVDVRDHRSTTLQATDDVLHAEHGFGWIQGVWRDQATVRFETRTSGVGPVRRVPVSELSAADPLLALDWTTEQLAAITAPDEDAATDHTTHS